MRSTANKGAFDRLFLTHCLLAARQSCKSCQAVVPSLSLFPDSCSLSVTLRIAGFRDCRIPDSRIPGFHHGIAGLLPSLLSVKKKVSPTGVYYYSIPQSLKSSLSLPAYPDIFEISGYPAADPRVWTCRTGSHMGSHDGVRTGGINWDPPAVRW